MTHEHNTSGFEPQSDRYKRIEELNHESFLMHEESPFVVVQSLHSVGAPRDILTEAYNKDMPSDVIAQAKAIGRHIVVGNVSPLNGYGPKEMSPEEKVADAQSNIREFLMNNNVDPANVRMLRPERDYTTPLTAVDVDQESLQPDDTGLLRPDMAGDFLYTYNQENVLAARPADCPIVFLSAGTPRGEVTVLLHLAWQGVAHGYISQAKQQLDHLGVDWSSLRGQITPGGQGETFKFNNFSKYNPHEQFPDSVTMFTDLETKQSEDGTTTYDFGVDLAAEVYEKLLETWGVDSYQLFLDTSDTTSPSAGYSSHSRSFKNYEVGGENSRDLVMAIRPQYPEQNPNKEAPIEILKEIVPLRVRYIDFDGVVQEGTIEVAKSVETDVKAFFEKAAELSFPIHKVVKSSDEAYHWDDDLLMKDNTTSGFNYRLIKGTDRPSAHGAGYAFDVNTALNPYVRYTDKGVEIDPPGVEYDPTQPGVLTSDHPLVEFMKKRGWEWGGDWPPESGRTDYQHFQKIPPSI